MSASSCAIAWSEQHGVMRHPVAIVAVGAEVQHEQGHGPGGSLQPAAPPVGGGGTRDRARRRCDVRRHWRPRRGSARGARRPRCAKVTKWAAPAPLPVTSIRRTGLRSSRRPPREVNRVARASYQGADAAAREEHSPTAFQEMDEGVDGAGLEWVSTYQEGVKAERLAHALVANEVGHGVVHRAVGAQCGEFRRHPYHVPEAQERCRRELFVAGLEDRARVVVETAVAGCVSRVAARDLRLQRRPVRAVVEAIAVRPQQPVERVDGDQLHVIRQVACRPGETDPAAGLDR